MHLLLEQGLYNSLDVQLAQVCIRLPHAHKYDWLPRRVRHGYRRPHLWYRSEDVGIGRHGNMGAKRRNRLTNEYSRKSYRTPLKNLVCKGSSLPRQACSSVGELCAGQSRPCPIPNHYIQDLGYSHGSPHIGCCPCVVLVPNFGRV